MLLWSRFHGCTCYLLISDSPLLLELLPQPAPSPRPAQSPSAHLPSPNLPQPALVSAPPTSTPRAVISPKPHRPPHSVLVSGEPFPSQGETTAVEPPTSRFGLNRPPHSTPRATTATTPSRREPPPETTVRSDPAVPRPKLSSPATHGSGQRPDKPRQPSPSRQQLGSPTTGPTLARKSPVCGPLLSPVSWDSGLKELAPGC